MKLLLDANFSPKLVHRLTEFFPDSLHVFQTGMARSTSGVAIWEYAKMHGFAIVTTDSDRRTGTIVLIRARHSKYTVSAYLPICNIPAHAGHSFVSTVRCKLRPMAALPHSPVVSVEEYLNTSYEPDMEFVDGVLLERKVGDWLHSLIQSNVLFALRRKYPHLKVVAELRSSITGTRYRLPDVCVVLTAPKTKYLFDAAYLVVEVLSEGDMLSVVIERLKEYAGKGIQNIWLIDPRLQLLWTYSPPALLEIEGESISTADRSVELARSEIFAA